jgi:membrane protease YdiL (CAAX protease family)
VSKSPFPVLPIVSELVFFGASFVVATGLLQIVLITGLLPDPNEAPWVGPVAGPAVMGLAALGYTFLQRRGERAMAAPIREELPPTSTAITVSATHIALALGGSVVIALVMNALGVPPEEQAAVQDIIAGGLSPELVLLGVAALVLAPIMEEWLFRGLFFRRLYLTRSIALAYAISAVAFALIHFNPSGLPTYIWLGLVFADAYRRSGRLWSASVVHFGNNAATLVFLLLGVE